MSKGTQENKSMDIKNTLKKYVWVAVIVALVVFIPVAFFVAEKFLSPAQTWYNNSWQFRKPITVSYTGTTKTNYDVELSVDTAALIAAGKIQNDCDDIRFVDSDDTTLLNYWIEAGCNTANTTIWVRVPSVPNGGTTVYMYYGNGSATSGQQVWGGSIKYFSNAGAYCPGDTAPDHAADNRFLMGGSTYGVTGGGSSHSHAAVSCTSSSIGGSSTTVAETLGYSKIVAATAHTHTGLSGTIGTASNVLPPYQDLLLCTTTNMRSYTTSAVNSAPASGVTAMFKNTNLPSGWTSALVTSNTFPRVSASGNGTGGSTTHTHTVTGGVVSGSTSGTTITSSNLDFGNGADGAITVAASTNMASTPIASGRTCADAVGYNVSALTSTTATLTATPAAGCLAVGDEILLISLHGNGTDANNVGHYEYLRIGGISSNVITFNQAKVQYYGDGASNDNNLGTGATNRRVVLQRVPNYTNVTINAGATLSSYSYAAGGSPVVVFKATGTVNVAGSINMTGGGFQGGAAGVAGATGNGWAGVNVISASVQANTAQATGGGGGVKDVYSGGLTSAGGGGGFGTAGTNGANNASFNASTGIGGIAYGSVASNSAFLGGGGGGGASYSDNGASPGAAGGNGGGIILLQVNSITVSGSILNNGNAGTAGSQQYSAGGGGGAGGSIYMAVNTATLGSNLVTATGGAGGLGGGTHICAGTAGCNGGAGGAGYIRIVYNTSISGTTNPAASTGQVTFANVTGDHTHTSTSGTTGTASNLPPYTDFRFAVAGSGANNASYDKDAVVMFTELPPLGWTRYSALDGKFPDGAATYGGTGGSNTHTHSVTVSTGAASSSYQIVVQGSYSTPLSTHTHSCTATTDSQSNVPPYYTVIYGTRNDNPGDGVSASFGTEASNVPLAPSSTGATALSTNSIRWNFIDNSSNETGFKVYTDTGVQQVDCPSADLSYCDEAGLSPNTSYTRKFIAYNAQGNSDFSNAVSRYTLMPVPTIGSGTITINSVALSVTGLSNLTDGTSGAYFDCSDSSCDTGLNNWIQTTSATATGLSPNTTYNFHVKGRNGESAETAYSDSIAVTTLADVPTISLNGLLTTEILGVPNYAIILTTGNTANLTNGSSGLYFDCTDSGCDTGLNSWIQTAGATATGLSPNTLYHFQVKARNAASTETTYSAPVAIYSPAAVPGTPTGVGLQSSSSVNVKVDPSTNPASTEFAIYEQTTDQYVSSVDGSLQPDPSWATYTTWGGTNGVDVTGLTGGTQYTFQVKARNGDNTETAFSGTVDLSTVLGTPTLTVGTISSSSITWSISTVTNATSYKLYDGSDNLIQTCASTSCLESGLDANTQYSRKVKAFNAVANSDFSNTLSKYTKTAAPTISGVVFSSNSATLTWTGNNPASTEFNIQDTESLKYLDPSSGLLVDGVVWGTYTDFSNVSSQASGLTPYTQYNFVITSRNGDNVTGGVSNASGGYTLATVPNNLTVGSVTDTTATMVLDRGSDPDVAEYLIYIVELNKYYNFNNGTLSDTAVGMFTTYTNLQNIVIPGLSSNTSYTVKIKARNQSGVETAYSSGTVLTTRATVPGKVVSNVVSSSIITVTVDPSTNDATTLFAVKANVSGLYVNHSTGVLQADPDWATYTDWGGVSGLAVINLSPDNNYQFVAIAKNLADVVTAQSSTYDDVYTLANTPGASTITRKTSSSLEIRINRNGNPDATEYAIHVVELNKYATISSCNPQNTIDWEVFGLWQAGRNPPPVVVCVPSTGEYTIEIKARNQNHVETAYSSGSVSIVLNAPTIGTPTFVDNVVDGGYDANSIKWNFTDNEATETGYRVFDTNGVQTAECVGTTLSFCTETGLTPNTSYTRKVAAYDSYGNGLFSSTATIVTPPANPGILTATTLSSSSINVKIDKKDNPSNVEFQLQSTFGGTNYVDPSTGEISSTPSWGTYSAFGGNSGINITGLNSDTQYRFKVRARNSDGIVSALSANSTNYTFANVPGKVVTSTPTTTTLSIVLNNSSNPTTTQYAVRSNVNGLYVNHATFVLQSDPDWATYSQWGSTTGVTVTGLDINNKYDFVASAKNGSDNITAESSTFDSTYTLANVPGVPTLAQVTATSARVTVDTNGNPTNTKYVVYFEELNKYVNNSTGALQVSPDWATYTNWGGSSGLVVTGLANGSSYTVKVKARNQDSVETAYNSSNITVSLAAPVIGVPELVDSLIQPNTIRWNFTENETEELGVRVYDTNGVQTAQCVGTSLTFCDESGLTPNTSYTRKLALYDINGHGTFSDTQTLSTLAATPSITSVTATGTTTLNVKFDTNGNPANTNFEILESTSGYYVNPSNGQLVADEVFGTYNDFGGSNGVSMTGLFSNANYTFKVRAINIDEVPTEYSPEVSKYTLAVQPGFVTTVVTGTTTMRIVINSTNNPSTLMSVRSNANGLYLNHTTHMLQGSPDYGTIADFGGNITGLNVINLDPNSRYQFVAIAKNGDNVLTAQSASYSSAYTLANTPSEPTVTRRTSSSVVVSINTNGNPSNTGYAVYLDELGKYLNSTTGQPTEDTPNWKTKANWDATTQNGLVVNNLSNGTYTFKVQARNQDGEETDFNLVKVFIQFDAPALSTPDVLSSSSIKWTFSNTVTGEVGYRVFDTNGVQVSQCSGADITECIEYGLSPNTSYTRKVAAYNNEGTGLFSETATAFTRAANPSITSITSGDSTSVNVKINRLSNPDVTQFEIQESISGYYVDPTNGQLVSGETWGTYAQFGGNNGINVTGLFANASYTFKVRARNNDNVTTVFSSEVTKYTKAVAPGVPTAASDAPTGVVLTVNNGGNSYNTEFAIKETTSNKYADNLSGVLSTTPKWVRMSDLAGSALRLSGLSANTRYSFLVTSRNGDGETTDSTSTVNIYTLANTPNPLTLSQIDSKDVKVKVGDIRNPANTQYSVMDKSTNNFLNVSTGLLDSTEVWGTSSDLGGTNGIQVKSLTPGKKYEFVIRARNGDAIATSYSTSSFVYTHSAIANLSGANAVTTRSLNIKINKQGNDDSVLYAVYEDNLKKYVDINTGFFVDNPSWGTYSTWGGDSGFVIPGLSPSTDYVFKVNSKNGIDQESGLGSKFTGGTNAIITNLPSFLTVGLASNFNVNPATVAGSQRGLQRILAQENNFRVADIPILFSTDRDWSNITIDSNPDESKTVVKVHESEGFTGKYIMYVVKNDSTRFILCTKAENINDVNINCDGSVVFVGPYPQTINVNGNDVKVSITIIDGVQYWMVEGLSGTGGLGVKVQDDGTVTEPSTSGNGGSNGSTGGTGGDNTGTGGDTTGTSGNVVQQTTTNVTKTVTNVVKAVQNVPKQTTQAIQGINTALDNTVGTLPQEQLTVVTTTASVATVTVGLASIGGGLSSLPYYVLELIFGVLSFLGFRKTGKPYGFVYDAVTKEPISRAVVRVYNSRDKLMWTDVTDVFGTFNAKLDKGKYKILVQKSGYKFPTQIIAGLSDYPLEPIYHGELVGLDSSKLFNVMIPVDPSGVNKFIKFSIRTKNIIEATVKYFNVGIFIAGLTLAIYMYNKYPNALNLLFVCVYIPTTLLILKNVLVAKKEWGKVTDRRGKPISGVEVVLKDMEYGRYVGKRITEADGLYRFVVSKGSYELLVVSQDYKVVKYEGGSNVIQIVKNDNEVIAKNIIVSKKASKK